MPCSGLLRPSRFLAFSLALVLVQLCGSAFFSTIMKLFTHSWLLFSRMLRCSKFLISWWNASWRWIGTLLGVCLASFVFGLEFIWRARKFPNSWICLYRFQGYPLFSMVLLWVGPMRLNVSWKLAAAPCHFHHWSYIIAAFQLAPESGCWISLRFQQSSRVSALQACSNCLGTKGWVMHLLMWHRTIAGRLGSSISGMCGTFQVWILWNSHMLPFIVMRAGVLIYHQLLCQMLMS